MRSKPSKNSTQNAPNAEQKRWLEKVAGLGPIIGYGPFNVHHLFGEKTQIKGIGNIGFWAIIPIPTTYHDMLHKQGRREFEKATGTTEKELFKVVCKRIERPFSDEIYEAILGYHK